jgi:hypothetical protein
VESVSPEVGRDSRLQVRGPAGNGLGLVVPARSVVSAGRSALALTCPPRSCLLRLDSQEAKKLDGLNMMMLWLASLYAY